MTSLIFYIVAPTERVMRVIGKNVKTTEIGFFRAALQQTNSIKERVSRESFPIYFGQISNKNSSSSPTLYLLLSALILPLFLLKLSYLFSFFLCHTVLFLLINNLYSKKSFP